MFKQLSPTSSVRSYLNNHPRNGFVLSYGPQCSDFWPILTPSNTTRATPQAPSVIIRPCSLTSGVNLNSDKHQGIVPSNRNMVAQSILSRSLPHPSTGLVAIHDLDVHVHTINVLSISLNMFALTHQLFYPLVVGYPLKLP